MTPPRPPPYCTCTDSQHAKHGWRRLIDGTELCNRCCLPFDPYPRSARYRLPVWFAAFGTAPWRIIAGLLVVSPSLDFFRPSPVGVLAADTLLIAVLVLLTVLGWMKTNGR